MAKLHYKDGTTLREIDGVYYKDGATLRTIQTAWYKDGSTLREIYSAALLVATWTHPASLSPSTFTDHAGEEHTVFSLSRRFLRGTHNIVLKVRQATIGITGPVPPNTNDTFVTLTIGTTVLQRSAASYFAFGVLGGLYSQWEWYGQGTALPTSGTRQITIK